jgi:hypothetical protein
VSPGFEATPWGLFSGGALVVGAAVGYLARVPARVVAGVMAFGSGRKPGELLPIRSYHFRPIVSFTLFTWIDRVR